jgi:hypothetical protein
MFFQDSSNTTEKSCDVVAKAIQYAQEELTAANSSGEISSGIKLVSTEQNRDEAIDLSRHLPVLEKHGHMKPSQHLPIHEWAYKFPDLQLADRQDVHQPEETKNIGKRARMEGNECGCEYEEQAVLRKVLKEHIMKELLEIHLGKK